jgi:RNA polymerase sigma-70 factor (ECF subfamily)
VAEDLQALALTAAAGDNSAFNELVRYTQTDIWRFCSYLVDHHSADDLTQDTYLRAHRALPRFRSDAPVLTWLLTIARRVCAVEIDRRTRAREISLHLTATHVRPPIDPTGAVDIERLIADLDPERRLAFVLTQVIGCDYAEAAAICQCPVGTIRSRVARARDDLVRQLSAAPSAAAINTSHHNRSKRFSRDDDA